MSTLHTKKPYARYISAVGVFLLKEENGKKFVLLQKRQNTGFADGFWEASAAGHVDEGEEMTDAVIHEATEELCVSIDKKDLEFICLVCKKNECFKKDTSRPGEESFAIYNGFFACRK
jgi:8-oxo-dGTP pyrophosphatase MutT (NUDIX family)